MDKLTNTDEVVVAFSAGKDSLCVLDLCVKRFKRVEAYFMYHVPDLSFQEEIVARAEKRYGLKIERIPHFDLPRLINRSGLNKARSGWLKEFKITDVENMMRSQFGIEWLASGESKHDSLQRRGMLTAMGPSSPALGVADHKRRRLYPICDWNRATVFTYMRRNHIPTPAFYKHLRSSLGRFRADELQAVHDNYPLDYEKILKVFPFMEAVRLRGEMYGNEEDSK